MTTIRTDRKRSGKAKTKTKIQEGIIMIKTNSKNINIALLVMAALAALAAILFFVPIYKASISFFVTITAKVSEFDLTFGKNVYMSGEKMELFDGSLLFGILFLLPGATAAVSILSMKIGNHKIAGLAAIPMSLIQIIIHLVMGKEVEEELYGMAEPTFARVLLIIILFVLLILGVVLLLATVTDAKAVHKSTAAGTVANAGGAAAGFNGEELKNSAKDFFQKASQAAGKAAGTIGSAASGAAAKMASKGAAKQICQNCGNAMTPGDKFCPACGALYVAPQPKTCPNCHAVMEDGDRFCRNCGCDTQAVQQTANAPAAAPAQEQPVMNAAPAFTAAPEAKAFQADPIPQAAPAFTPAPEAPAMNFAAEPAQEVQETVQKTAESAQTFARETAGTMQQAAETVQTAASEPDDAEARAAVLAAMAASAAKKASPAVCPNCGNPLEPGEKFCGECGTRIQ